MKSKGKKGSQNKTVEAANIPEPTDFPGLLELSKKIQGRSKSGNQSQLRSCFDQLSKISLGLS